MNPAPTNPDELRLTLSLALRQDGRRKAEGGDTLPATSNYVVMGKRAAPAAQHADRARQGPFELSGFGRFWHLN